MNDQWAMLMFLAWSKKTNFTVKPLASPSWSARRARRRQIGPAFARASGRGGRRCVLGQHAGDRPEPAVTEGGASLPYQRADDGLPAHDGQVLVAGLPVGAWELLGGTAQIERHQRRPEVFLGTRKPRPPQNSQDFFRRPWWRGTQPLPLQRGWRSNLGNGFGYNISTNICPRAPSWQTHESLTVGP